MPYPTIPGRRFEYDIGGGSVYEGNNNGDVTAVMSAANIKRLNAEGNTVPALSAGVSNVSINRTLWVFIPQKYAVAGLGMIHNAYSTRTPSKLITVHGSPDTTNGLDGTWLEANMPGGAIPASMMDDDVWRDSILPCTFSEPVKAVRINYFVAAHSGGGQYIDVYALHIYGVKAAGEVPDDILFLDDDQEGDPELIRDLDFGDRPEGTTITKRIRLMNSSTTKMANNLTLTLIDQDFAFSLDEGNTWVTGATITSLAPQAKSASIIIKNTIPPPTQMLGPRAPRFEVSIGSWT